MYEVDFIGAGWAFPLGADPTGGVALVTREREIEQAIRLILGTAIGERPMRPEFGCRIHDYVFAPGQRRDRRPDRLRRPRCRWSGGRPRIDVDDVLVSFDRIGDRAALHRHPLPAPGPNDPRNLVFPFYVIPAESTDPQAELIERLTACPPPTSTTGASRTWSTTPSGSSSSVPGDGPTTTCPTRGSR